MLHSAFEPFHGFRGTIEELTNALLEAIGPEGNLLMVSLAYGSSSLEYLKNLKLFDVRKTPSMMGLVSEFFRRRPNVLRSLHPTHPMLALGPKAEWIVADHELSEYPLWPRNTLRKTGVARCERPSSSTSLLTTLRSFTFWNIWCYPSCRSNSILTSLSRCRSSTNRARGRQ